MALGTGSAGTGLDMSLNGKRPLRVPSRGNPAQQLASTATGAFMGGKAPLPLSSFRPVGGGLPTGMAGAPPMATVPEGNAFTGGRQPLPIGPRPRAAGPDYGAPGQPGSSVSGDSIPGGPGTAIAAGVTGATFPVMQGAAQAQQMQQYYDALMNVASTGNTGQNNLLALQQEFAAQQHAWAVNQATQNYGYENQFLNSAAGRADMDVSSAQFDIDKLNAQQGYNQYLGGAYDQQYQSDLAYIGQQYGFNTREFNIAKQQLDAQRAANQQTYGLAGKDRSLAEQMAQLSYESQQRAAKSDAIARGALGSGGYAASQLETWQQLGLANMAAKNRYEGAGIDYNLTGANLDAAGGRAQLGFEQTGAGLGKQESDLGIQYGLDKEKLSLAQKTLGMDVRQAELAKGKLESIAKDYGLKAEQLNFLFMSGLEKLGMDAYQGIAQLGQMMASNDENLIAQGAALIAQILGVQGGM